MKKNCSGVFLVSILLLSLVASCTSNQEKTKLTEDTPANSTAAREDTVITRLRPAIIAIESHNLQLGGYQLRSIGIDSIQYEMISLKNYYILRRDDLKKNLHLSTDKEKTNRVIDHLQQLAAKAPDKPEIYKVRFFMRAEAGETRYNEWHSNFLKPDLSELRIDFKDVK